MRTSKGLIVATAVGLALGLVPTLPFDGSGSPDQQLRVSPNDALRSGIEELKGGNKANAAISLQYAAEHGNEYALWQLAHMYAKGDGVPLDNYRAFEYFQKFADGNSNINPAAPRARYVSDAFIALGNYYFTGIPNSPVTSNPELGQRMLIHAASYFGDPEAQYQLARLLLDGKLVSPDPKRAVAWLNQAAYKRHYQAQAVLGRILFYGEAGQRPQRATGLMWLIIANDGAGANVPWIADLRANALKEATDKERNEARELLTRWLQGRPPR
ncbi:MAG TPA: tetratricopeptide repeat protein [Xanthobacteraceae bacterium]|nr:tetratricopeptide repeat protein [Xanthobacteraceae bacterium]